MIAADGAIGVQAGIRVDQDTGPSAELGHDHFFQILGLAVGFLQAEVSREDQVEVNVHKGPGPKRPQLMDIDPKVLSFFVDESCDFF